MCWGAYGSQVLPPSGKFTSIAGGDRKTCGVQLEGAIACWGSGILGEDGPPTGVFTGVTAGDGYNCGLRPNARIECWGFEQRPAQD